MTTEIRGCWRKARRSRRRTIRSRAPTVSNSFTQAAYERSISIRFLKPLRCPGDETQKVAAFFSPTWKAGSSAQNPSHQVGIIFRAMDFGCGGFLQQRDKFRSETVETKKSLVSIACICGQLAQ